MSRNGLGTYTRVPGSAYTNGTVNDGSELDAEMNDIATALTDSLTADGQKTWAANQKAGTYKITGMGAGSASTDSVNLGQVQAQAYTWLTSVTGVDTITASCSPAITAYAAGQTFRFVAAGDNTGAVTLNIGGLGAKDVKRNATVLSASDIVSGEVLTVTYDGTLFQVVTPSGLASVAASETRAGLIELATTAEAQAGTDAVRAITPATLKSAQIVAGTAVDLSTGSPSSATFAIPSWAKKVTISMIGISLTGTDIPVIRLGTSGGLETSGYTGGVVSGSSGASPTSTANSTSFRLKDTSLAAQSWDGKATLVNNGGNRWSFDCPGFTSSAVWSLAAGSKTLSDVLTQIQLIRTGTDTFDAGYINVLCE